MKDSAILSSELFLVMASVGKPQQSICSRICFTLVIVNLKMVSRELLGPADLSGARALYIHETIEVIMVHKDENFMFAAFQVVMPSFECLNDG